MRLPTSALALAAAAVSAPFLATPALAAFEGDFALTDGASPAGYYTLESGVASLGNWSAGFFPTDGGTSFIDTSGAPGSVTLGATAPGTSNFIDGTTVLFIDLPIDGHVSFTIQVANSGEGDFYAGAEIYLSGEVLYALTEPGSTHTLDFDAFSGETLEFRSVVFSGTTTSSASSIATITNFTVTTSAIPEPSAFASLAGLLILGRAATRRRRST